jgi:hypothetical protein
MSRRYVPVGRLAVVAALVVGGWAVSHRAGGLRWRAIGPGVEFAMLRGEPFCRRGSSGVALLRIEPRRVRLAVRHYTLEPDHTPLTIVEWLRRSGALAVFNAGQYYPDFSYMGLLVCDGHVVSDKIHPRFQAALVASPERGGWGAHVLDLSHVALDPERPGWRQVAQSFMLFDHSGTTRVRKSSQIANRTVVAEDRRGRLVVVASEGAYTLYDFARLLRDSPLQLSHAMVMDGGAEAELCVRAGAFRYASYGRWEEGPEPAAQVTPVTLPAVITVATR